jgi:endonuclease-3
MRQLGYVARVAAKKKSADPALAKPAAKPSAAAPASSLPPDAARVRSILRVLESAIPEPYCELDHTSPWTLLIATILSAQSNDKTINSVTPALFAKWPTPAALAAAPRDEVEQAVHKTGFFRNKAKSIQECSLLLVERHGGEVPRTMEELIELPGVARKTANVVLGTAYRIPVGIATDTHVMRVSQKLLLTSAIKPEKIEQDLCALLPKDQWTDGGHRILLHGRYVCLAKGPQCEQCPLNELCPSREAEPVGSVADRARRARRVVESRGAEG